MKILCLGDFHLNDKQPVNRIDDYWDTAKRKFEFVLSIARRKGASVIVSPGDFTDSPSISYSAYSDILSILKENLNNRFAMVTVFGQHDMRYRTIENTALCAIEVAFANSLEFRILMTNEVLDIEDVTFCGSSYGEEIPSPFANGKFSVLIVHRMIIDEKLWSTQEEYEPSNIFLRQHPFDLIISGDNHRPFISETKGKRLLINCGAMLRSNIDQIEHKPYVVLFDTKTREYEKIFIPIEEGEKVFRIEEIELTKERNANLETFIAGLSSNKSIDLTCEDNLKKYIKENNISEDVNKFIVKAMKKGK